MVIILQIMQSSMIFPLDLLETNDTFYRGYDELHYKLHYIPQFDIVYSPKRIYFVP